MPYRMFVVLLAGCAAAGSSREAPTDDASTSIDAPVVSGIDAPPPCNPIMTQLLANPSLDAAPDGTGWNQTPIDAELPIITADPPLVPQTAPNKAWMGGIAEPNANDQLFQDVMIPARTTGLVVTGFFDVRTGETGGVKDTATVTLTKPDGTVIDNVLATDNTQPTTGWTALDHTIPTAAALSGQTVRLRLATHNDAVAGTETSFFFDSFAMTVTHCE